MNEIQANVKTIDPTLRAFVLAIDDLPWSSPKARAEGMRKLTAAQRGSLGQIDSIKFAQRLAEQTIRRLLPPMLRQIGLHDVADRCEKEGTWEAAHAAYDAAKSAARHISLNPNADDAAAKAVSAACLAAVSAFNAAINADADAADAAANAAEAAAYAAYAAEAAEYAAKAAAANAAHCAFRYATNASAEAAVSAARDGVLTLMCDICIDILRDMRAPGIALMDQVC